MPRPAIYFWDIAQDVVVLYGPYIEAFSSVMLGLTRLWRLDSLKQKGKDLRNGSAMEPRLIITLNI